MACIVLAQRACCAHVGPGAGQGAFDSSSFSARSTPQPDYENLADDEEERALFDWWSDDGLMVTNLVEGGAGRV
ncbi:hypothetical protein L227DRAFT_575956 [Lentinus tigrinus ALCF2SS1-6]|uniref:Uncharacterized protein n=1 Tax=Lentinus tigrinus ALCF2SS1-6 TaxID=1328759 RepID=A0A5C2S7V4_9APHY|nr:hypothetical protein L227DRAFT_575956 [Lentinus tigrinus ALCF2SS1-6]